MTSTETESLDRSGTSEVDIVHVMCDCLGEEKSLCGLEMQNAPWVGKEDLEECVVCVDLEPAHSECPNS